MKEEWRIIEEAPDYLVSTLGKIYSNLSKKILNPSYDKDGYYRVTLRRRGKKSIYRRVHQLVAKAFIKNPNNYHMINHLNNIRNDNRVENLEWCDNSRNQTYSYQVMGRKWNRQAHIKDFTKIEAFNIITKECMTFDSVNACARYHNVSDSAIFNRLRGRTKNPSNSNKSLINFIYFKEI